MVLTCIYRKDVAIINESMIDITCLVTLCRCTVKLETHYERDSYSKLYPLVYRLYMHKQNLAVMHKFL